MWSVDFTSYTSVDAVLYLHVDRGEDTSCTKPSQSPAHDERGRCWRRSAQYRTNDKDSA